MIRITNFGKIIFDARERVDNGSLSENIKIMAFMKCDFRKIKKFDIAASFTGNPSDTFGDDFYFAVLSGENGQDTVGFGEIGAFDDDALCFVDSQCKTQISKPKSQIQNLNLKSILLNIDFKF